MSDEIKEGDVVAMRSGSTHFTVAGFEETERGTMARAYFWDFKKEEPVKVCFAPHMLRKVS